MRTFLAKIGLFLLPFVFFTAAIFVVDPMGVYPGKQWFEPISRMARPIKTADFLESERDFDAFILGSSRCVRFDAADLESAGYHAYNFALFNAMAEDLYAVTRLIVDESKVPVRLILLGLDPTMLQAGKTVDWRLQMVPGLKKYLLAEDREPEHKFMGRYIQTSARYTLRSIYYAFNGMDVSKSTAIRPENGNLVSTPLPKQDVENARILSTIHEYSAVADQFTALDDKRIEYLRKIVDLCEKKDISLVLFLTPLHPDLDTALCENTPYGERLNEIRAILPTLTSLNVSWVDFSTPSDFGGNDEDFTDGAHIGSYNSSILLDSLLQRHR